MKQTNEHIHSREHGVGSSQREAAAPATLLRAGVTTVLAQREKALLGIERYLTTQTREHIRGRIEEERRAFTDLMRRTNERKSKLRAAREVLPPTFFEHKPFDTTILE